MPSNLGILICLDRRASSTYISFVTSRCQTILRICLICRDPCSVIEPVLVIFADGYTDGVRMAHFGSLSASLKSWMFPISATRRFSWFRCECFRSMSVSTESKILIPFHPYFDFNSSIIPNHLFF